MQKLLGIVRIFLDVEIIQIEHNRPTQAFRHAFFL
jgi:hypothetical protein